MNRHLAPRFASGQTRPLRLAWVKIVFALITFSLPSAILGREPPSQSKAMADRSAVFFDQADFYKPVERDTDSLPFKLAPLLLQELDPANASKPPAELLQPTALEPGSSSPVTNVVYVQPEVFQFHGASHLAFTYLWFYSAAPKSRPHRGLPVQGVRLVLNSAGEPILWEILVDPSGDRRFFIARSLEAQAQDEFGAPLPRRRFAIERAAKEAPRAVVARVIEDGPVPMGPIVYLSARTQAVSTLICRCMPAQAKNVRQNILYDLVPWPGQASAELAHLGQTLQSRHLATFWPGENNLAAHLESFLRLPSKF